MTATVGFLALISMELLVVLWSIWTGVDNIVDSIEEFRRDRKSLTEGEHHDRR